MSRILVHGCGHHAPQNPQRQLFYVPLVVWAAWASAVFGLVTGLSSVRRVQVPHYPPDNQFFILCYVHAFLSLVVVGHWVYGWVGHSAFPRRGGRLAGFQRVLRGKWRFVVTNYYQMNYLRSHSIHSAGDYLSPDSHFTHPILVLQWSSVA